MSILTWIEEKKRLKLLNVPKKVSSSTDSSKGLWTRCDKCGVILYIKHLKENQRVCFGCSYHLQMMSHERIENLLDKVPAIFSRPVRQADISSLKPTAKPVKPSFTKGKQEASRVKNGRPLSRDTMVSTWRPLDETVSPCDPLKFHDQKKYTDRLKDAQERTGLQDAVETGTGMIDGIPVALAVMDFSFMGGSMGSVVGEKITRLIEYATAEGLTLLIVSASGGARMQEGVFSLMQMAKISSALQMYQSCAKLLYISILTSPTTGGVTASFAMLGDIIFAEPKALIAFAGRRVIEQTLAEDLPEDFQTSESMLHHGLVDLIVPRRFLRQALSETIRLYQNAPFKKSGTIPFGVQNPITFLIEERVRRRWGPLTKTGTKQNADLLGFADQNNALATKVQTEDFQEDLQRRFARAEQLPTKLSQSYSKISPQKGGHAGTLLSFANQKSLVQKDTADDPLFYSAKQIQGTNLERQGKISPSENLPKGLALNSKDDLKSTAYREILRSFRLMFDLFKSGKVIRSYSTEQKDITDKIKKDSVFRSNRDTRFETRNSFLYSAPLSMPVYCITALTDALEKKASAAPFYFDAQRQVNNSYLANKRGTQQAVSLSLPVPLLLRKSKISESTFRTVLRYTNKKERAKAALILPVQISYAALLSLYGASETQRENRNKKQNENFLFFKNSGIARARRSSYGGAAFLSFAKQNNGTHEQYTNESRNGTKNHKAFHSKNGTISSNGVTNKTQQKTILTRVFRYPFRGSKNQKLKFSRAVRQHLRVVSQNIFLNPQDFRNRFFWKEQKIEFDQPFVASFYKNSFSNKIMRPTSSIYCDGLAKAKPKKIFTFSASKSKLWSFLTLQSSNKERLREIDGKNQLEWEGVQLRNRGTSVVKREPKEKLGSFHALRYKTNSCSVGRRTALFCAPSLQKIFVRKASLHRRLSLTWRSFWFPPQDSPEIQMGGQTSHVDRPFFSVGPHGEIDNFTLLHSFRSFSERHLESQLSNTNKTSALFSQKSKETLASKNLISRNRDTDIDFLNQAIELAATERICWRAFYIDQQHSEKIGFLKLFYN